MGKKLPKIDFAALRRESATSKRDIGFLRIYDNFEQVIFTLEKDCYYTEDIKKAIDLMKWARTYAATQFMNNSVSNA